MTKKELQKEAADLGIETIGTETAAELESLIQTAQNTPPGGRTTDDAQLSNEPDKNPQPLKTPEEQMVPLSSVKALIAEAMASMSEANKPIKPKKVLEHTVHVHRFEGQWVIDFVDQNKDPYVKEKVHAFQKFNEQKREFEAWIEIKLAAGTIAGGVEMAERTLQLPLNRYIERRQSIYLPIIKRNKHDTSYVIGEVDKKTEDPRTGLLKNSGTMIDQEVTQYYETFTVKTLGDDMVREIPDWAIC